MSALTLVLLVIFGLLVDHRCTQFINVLIRIAGALEARKE